ncbi:hypothetical protein JQC91_01685 [Jannaschia sp. Os4]|uniref:hypothetical protein n=1 Tax=Jannaschia sp. Os4 TaxID=2807617 RepID=UPI00193A96DD|nr:hypothetical protein [Jannaschia sp. Os4]
MSEAERAAAILADLPLGAFRVRSGGKDWLVSHLHHAAGRSEKLVARSLDGSDYVSLNLYRLESGPRLKPCEMPVAKVMRFLEGIEATQG